MQYKNPVDKELVLASEEAYNTMVKLAEFLGVAHTDWPALQRLGNAMENAKTEMQFQEEEDRTDFLTTTNPPSSND